MGSSTMADQYQLMEELGSGSFGVVYKAIERTTGEVVAIKHVDLEASEEDIQEIQGEINVLSTCASPYVTQYKTSFLRGSKLWIVMEYLGGGSCQDLLKPGPFNEAHVAIVCRELLLGLDYLHREGKIHRDIKAANVLLANSGKVKLADFGVAAQMTNIKSIRNTFVGTPFWMAPEVIQEAGYDYHADLWSLGITAMEMINGEPPHSQIHPMKVLFLIPKAPAPRLEGNQYSREFKDFIANCLIKDPDRRPSAKELLQHKFIRSAGKVEALQELIQRRQQWDSETGKVSHPKFYEEAMTLMASKAENDGWNFDTIKAPTMYQSRFETSRRRSRLTTETLPEDSTEAMMFNLTLEERATPTPAPQPAPQPQPESVRKAATTRRLSTKRRASGGTHILSPSKARKPSGQRQPLGPDMSFGNSASSVRQFQRVPENEPEIASNGAIIHHDENTNPYVDNITKEALVGRQAFTKVIDGVFQEVLAQTANHSRREAISRAHQAWNALDLNDPEGEFQIMKLIMERIQNNSKLSALHPAVASTAPSTPQKPKLVLAQNNPHLKSHRRRQSALVGSANGSTSSSYHLSPEKQLANLPGQAVPGMEHTKQLADALYGKWVDGLKNRWPVMS